MEALIARLAVYLGRTPDEVRRTVTVPMLKRLEFVWEYQCPPLVVSMAQLAKFKPAITNPEHAANLLDAFMCS